MRPKVEVLEDRITPFTITPTWIEMGPDQILTAPAGRPWGNASGALEAIAIHPSNPEIVYVGAVNGGVWRTTEFSTVHITGAWEPLTDYEASLSIGALAISPVNGDVVFAGTGAGPVVSAGGQGGLAKGILRSVDAGANWQVIDGGIFANQTIRNIIPTGLDASGNPLPPGAPPTNQVVLAAAWDRSNPTAGGVFRSEDGGATWWPLSGSSTTDSSDNDRDGIVDNPGETTGLPTGGAAHLVVDPLDAQRFFAGIMGRGVYGTEDGGRTWFSAGNHVSGTLLTGQLTLTNDGFDNDGDEDGVVADEADEGIDTADRIELAYHSSSQGNVVYAALLSDAKLGEDDDGNDISDPWRLRALFRSEDQGATWRQATNLLQTNPTPNGQGEVHFAMIADPDDPYAVYVRGTTGGFRVRFDPSPAQNDQWLNIGGAPRPHPDARDLAFLPRATPDAPLVLLEADDGGLYSRNLQEVAWVSHNKGLRTVEMYSVAVQPGPYLFGGTQDNASIQMVNGNALSDWEAVIGGDGNTVAIDNSGVNATRYLMGNNLHSFIRRINNPDNEFLGASIVSLSHVGDPFRIPLSGVTAADRAFSDFRIYPFVLNSVEPPRLLLGGIDGLYESMNGGDTVTNIAPAGMTSPTAVAYGGRENGAARPEIAYVGTGSGQLFVRETAAGGFVPKIIDTDMDGNPDNGGIEDLVVHPDNWRIAYVIDAANVYMTQDAGDTWTNITGTLGMHLQDFQTITMASPGSTDIIWVGGLPKDPQFGGVFAVINPQTEQPTGLNGNWPIWYPYGDVTDRQLEGFGSSSNQRERLPNVLVTDLFYEPKFDSLAAATFGRGAWLKLTFASVTAQPSTIRGRVFEDVNGNEVFDPGESPQTHVVYLDLNNNAALDTDEPSMNARADGTYEFPNLPPGRYSVRQQGLSEDWLTITPQGGIGEVVFSSLTGGGVEVLDFANARPVSIRGSKYEDINGNGVRDAGEPFLSDWLFFIDTNHNGVHDSTMPARFESTDTPLSGTDADTTVSQLQVSGIQERITDVNVTIHLEHLDSQRLAVELVSPSGTVVTLVGTRNVFGASSTPDDYADTTFDDEAIRLIPLGGRGPFQSSYQPQSVLGRLDGQEANGVWQLRVKDNTIDSRNVNILSWSLEINTGEQFTRTSGLQGAYRFGGLPPGTHSVSEPTPFLIQQVMIPVNPSSGTRDVTVTSGINAQGQDFANAHPAAIRGMKFHDRDQDGLRDPETEPGLEGFEIYLDLNQNGMLDSNPSPSFEALDVPKPLQITPQELSDGAQPTRLVRSTIPVRGLHGTIERIRVTQDFDINNPLPPGVELRLYLNWLGLHRIPLEIAPEVTLDAFVGLNPNVTWWWEAEMSDGSLLPAGVLQSWSIEFDLREPTALTDSAGNYEFSFLRPGEYHVREFLSPEQASCWVQTAPENGLHVVTLSSGGSANGIDFGNVGCGLTFTDAQAFLVRQSFTRGPDVAIIGVALGQLQTTFNGRVVMSEIPRQYIITAGEGDDNVTIDGAIFDAGVEEVILRGGGGSDRMRVMGSSSQNLQVEHLDHFQTKLTLANGRISSGAVELVEFLDPQKDVQFLTRDTTLHLDAVNFRQTFTAPRRTTIDVEVDPDESGLELVVSGNNRLELGRLAFTRPPRISAGPQPEPPVSPDSILIAPLLAGPQPEPPLGPVEISGFGPEDRIVLASATLTSGTPLPTDARLSFAALNRWNFDLVVGPTNPLAQFAFRIESSPNGAGPELAFAGSPAAENRLTVISPVAFDFFPLKPVPLFLTNTEMMTIVGGAEAEELDVETFADGSLTSLSPVAFDFFPLKPLPVLEMVADHRLATIDSLGVESLSVGPSPVADLPGLIAHQVLTPSYGEIRTSNLLIRHDEMVSRSFVEGGTVEFLVTLDSFGSTLFPHDFSAGFRYTGSTGKYAVRDITFAGKFDVTVEHLGDMSNTSSFALMNSSFAQPATLKIIGDKNGWAEVDVSKTNVEGKVEVIYKGAKTELDIVLANADTEPLFASVENPGGTTSIQKVGNVIVTVPDLVGTGIDPTQPFTTFVVTTTLDSGPGSLRAAIDAANVFTGDGLAVITFAVPDSDLGFSDVDAHLASGDADPDAFVISPLTALPPLLRGNIVVNGQSQQNLTGDTNPFGPEIVLAGHQAVAVEVLDGLVSRYRFNGTVEDVAGDNEPSATAGVAFVDGQVGQGVTFTPGGYVDIPHSDDLAQQVFTLSAWVRPDGPGPNDDFHGSVILAKGIPAELGGGQIVSVELTYSTQLNRFLFGFGNFFDDATRIISVETFAPGEFYHVAATYDGATFRLYVNGRLQGEKALVKTIDYDSTIPWAIGSTPAGFRAVGFPRTWNGVIDEVGIYNRALTAAEIQTLATPVNGLHVASSDNLVHGLNIQGFSGHGVFIDANNNTLTGNYIGASVTGDASASVLPGIVSWWPGEGNAEDVTGNHDGTLVDGTAFAPGMVGQAFSLDGVDDYIDVGPGYHLDAMTLEAWVFIDPATNTGERRVISKDNIFLDGTRKAFALKSSSPYANDRHGHATFGVLVRHPFDRTSPDIDVISSPSPLTAGWHHMTGVRDTAAGRFELYVDGVLVASKTPTAIGVIDSDANTVIGNVNNASNIEQFSGLIDEPAIFGRALSTAEVQSIYNRGSAGKGANNPGNGGDGVHIVNSSGNQIGGAREAAGNVISGNAGSGVVIAGGGQLPALVGSWQAEGNAVDSVGDNDGEIVGVGFTTGARGGQAFQFDGVDDYVHVANAPELESEHVTLSAWVKSATLIGDIDYFVVKGGHLNVAGSYALYQINGNVHFYIFNGATFIPSPALPAAAVYDSEWHHLAGTYDGQHVRLFVDGQEVGNGTATTDPIKYALPSSNDLFIGNYIDAFNGGTFNFAGAIDEVALFNEALTADQVAVLHATGSVVTGANRVQGNFIGTTADGLSALGNGVAGVSIDESAGNLIGGPNKFARNVISGNLTGVSIVGTAASNNHVAGNYIGLGADGLTPIIGNEFGVLVQGGAGNVIGGTNAAERNVISGNGRMGIHLAATQGTIVQGNYVGTDATGAHAPVRTRENIRLSDDAGSLIGGTETGAGNVVAGGGWGIYLSGRFQPTQGTRIQGNRIGTTADGQRPLGNVWGVYVDGFVDSDGITRQIRDVLIGGAEEGAGNLISANQNQGIVVFGPGSQGITIQGNLIGTDIDGAAALPNGLPSIANPAGVLIESASGVQIGGTDKFARNVIAGNNGSGVVISGGSKNIVQGNYIGTTAGGMSALGNGAAGVSIDNSVANLIGGAGRGNVISANGTGVLIQGVASTDNAILGNLIGTDTFGTAALGNEDGIAVSNAGSNRIGGPAKGERNVISGNARSGVHLSSLSGNTVQGNVIGADITGNFATGLGNGHGIFLNGDIGSLIGGSGINQGNLIAGGGWGIWMGGTASHRHTSGTRIEGNRIGTSADGLHALGNSWGIYVEGRDGHEVHDVVIGGTDPEAGNLISGNIQDGISIHGLGAHNVTILGNLIGTDIDGVDPLPNGTGVLLEGASGVHIGGTRKFDGNVISGNTSTGLSIVGGSGHVVEGNHFGTNRLGSFLGNGGNGIDVSAASGVQILNNAVGANKSYGVLLNGASENHVAGNLIGSTRLVKPLLPNAIGLSIQGGGANTVADNVVSGNAQVGIELLETNNNTLRNNNVGVASDGSTPIGNAVGVVLAGASFNLLDSNTISGNHGAGVEFLFGAATGNRLFRNRIGTSADGAVAAGNGGFGVLIGKGASGNFIGTDGDGDNADNPDDPTQGNTIAHNALAGVAVITASSAGNRVRGNSIHSNGGLGIDLNFDLVTANDIGDPDANPPVPPDTDLGPNGLQNYPEIQQVVATSNGIQVFGQLRSAPSAEFIVDFYASSAADPSDHGEGQRWLGALTITTGEEGVGSIKFDLALESAALGEYLTATATHIATGDTSEFSKATLITQRGGGKKSLAASASPELAAADTVTMDQAQPLILEANAGWNVAMPRFDVRIADLPGLTLGKAAGPTIWLDVNAAGWGWFVDSTPREDWEFLQGGDQGQKNRTDLLTAIVHELGDVLGHGHEDDGMRQETPATGTRLVYEEGALLRARAREAVFAQLHRHRRTIGNPFALGLPW